jgi:hypothetical protein
MEGATESAAALRSRAAADLGSFAATLAVGILLVIAFDPDVQSIGAAELVARSDDARRFLIADYVFIFLYAVVSPIAIWRFGSAVGAGTPPPWAKLAAALLVAGGIIDATENALLLSATGSLSTGAVDAAHDLKVPKLLLTAGGAVFAIVAVVRAVRILRAS